MIFDPRKFKVGSKVRFAEYPALAEFRQTWNFHHPLGDEQLSWAGKTAEVTEASMYHGGDIIYRLKDIPGVWHERLLEACK